MPVVSMKRDDLMFIVQTQPPIDSSVTLLRYDLRNLIVWKRFSSIICMYYPRCVEHEVINPIPSIVWAIINYYCRPIPFQYYLDIGLSLQPNIKSQA